MVWSYSDFRTSDLGLVLEIYDYCTTPAVMWLQFRFLASTHIYMMVAVPCKSQDCNLRSSQLISDKQSHWKKLDSIMTMGYNIICLTIMVIHLMTAVKMVLKIGSCQVMTCLTNAIKILVPTVPTTLHAYNYIFPCCMPSRMFLLTHTSNNQDDVHTHRHDLEYIIGTRRWKKSVVTAKTWLGADCEIDHKLFMSFEIKLKWKKTDYFP